MYICRYVHSLYGNFDIRTYIQNYKFENKFISAIKGKEPGDTNGTYVAMYMIYSTT